MDDQNLLAELLQAQNEARPVVLATVVRARGSVPRRSGTKMLVYADGRISGTVGGGEMEARVIEESQIALADGKTRLLPYSLVDPNRGDPGVCGGEVEVYLEPYPPPATLLIVGCGHVGKATASLAHWLGYRVAVSDDRPELASSEHIPEADIFLPGAFDEVVDRFPIQANTFVLLLTRNVGLDRDILPHLLQTPATYIGVIGSRRRWRKTQELLLASGVTEEQLERFHSPLGLELNAETPEEIAVSIMAEVIMMQRGGTGARMKG